jgi:D-alanyl-D-alanine dipeptidase
MRAALLSGVLALAAPAGAMPAAGDRGFVDVAAFVPGIRIELPYATTKNAFHRRIYATKRAFLRRGTAVKLRRAQTLLARRDLGLLVWDAYRPRSVQKAMWEQVRNPRYVGPPTSGSRHSRGVAVDVTLVDRKGRPLPMPTGFDDFSPRAHARFRGASREAAHNRATLRRAMLSAGFRPQETEWWHFNDSDATRYPIDDVKPSDLAQRNPSAHSVRYVSSKANQASRN